MNEEKLALATVIAFVAILIHQKEHILSSESKRWFKIFIFMVLLGVVGYFYWPRM